MAESRIQEPLNAAVFSQVLSKEPHWYTLGTFLGAREAELRHIDSTHSKEGLIRCYIEVYNCLQGSGKCLSWDDVVTSLKQMNSNYLAEEIELRFLIMTEPGGNASIKYVKVESPEVAEIANQFKKLSERFISLQAEVTRAFKNATIDIAEIQHIIEGECGLLPLSKEEATIDAVFARLNRRCSILNFRAIVFLVESHLKTKKVLRKKLADFEKAVDQFNASTKMVQLAKLVKEKQTLTGNDKIVKLVVRNFWNDHTIKQFQYAANEILGTLYNVTTRICISKGSICISWVIPDINATKLIPDHSLEFLKIIGVLSLHVGDEVIYNIEGEGCETIEAAMLQAIELKNTRAIELLLAVGCNPEVAIYNDDNAVTIIVNMRESKKSSFDIVCTIGHNEHVEAIVDPTSKEYKCNSCVVKDEILRQHNEESLFAALQSKVMIEVTLQQELDKLRNGNKKLYERSKSEKAQYETTLADMSQDLEEHIISKQKLIAEHSNTITAMNRDMENMRNANMILQQRLKDTWFQVDTLQDDILSLKLNQTESISKQEHPPNHLDPPQQDQMLHLRLSRPIPTNKQVQQPSSDTQQSTTNVINDPRRVTELPVTNSPLSRYHPTAGDDSQNNTMLSNFSSGYFSHEQSFRSRDSGHFTSQRHDADRVRSSEVHSRHCSRQEHFGDDDDPSLGPYDPNLVCNGCGMRYRYGEIHKLRRHTKEFCVARQYQYRQ